MFGGRAMTTGQLLHAARLRKGRELRDIARATNIPVTLLEAIEADDMTRVPGGLFARAYLRAFALQVDIDPATLVQRHLEEHRAASPQEELQALRVRWAARGKPGREWIGMTLVAAVLALLILTAIFAGGGRSATDDDPSDVTPASDSPEEPPRRVIARLESEYER